MKTHVFALIALFFLLAATSCQKKPTASFSTDKDIYTTDENVQTNNTSSDAFFYTWIVKGPGGYENRGSAENFSFMPSIVGDYEIALTVYSRNGKVSSRSSKTISSKTPFSSYIFYTDVLDGVFYNSVSVYVDNMYIGTINTNCPYRPACGDIKGITTTISKGIHDLRFNFAPYNLNKNFNGVSLTSTDPCITWEIMN